MTLETYLHQIQPLDAAAMQAAQARWDGIAKPLHSLGRLEEQVVQLAGIRGAHPTPLKRRVVTVFCADNGVVEEGVTQIGSEITALVAQNLAQGKAIVNTMATLAQATVLPVDIGMAAPQTIPGVLPHRVAEGSRNIAKGAAMSRAQAETAILTGIRLVKTLRENGCDVIATGEMGIGNTTTSSAMASVFLKEAPENVTGKGAGLSEQGLQTKIAVIRRAIAVNQPDPDDPLDVLSKLGGYDLAGLAGVFLGGGIHRVPIVMDGLISTVAALTAVRLCPTVSGYLLASHISREPAARMLLDALGKKPLLTCEMALGEGTGAVAALPILDMALAVYHTASTFSDIKMQPYEPLG